MQSVVGINKMKQKRVYLLIGGELTLVPFYLVA